LFFGDYGADPLWAVPSEGMVDVETLPVSHEVCSSVREWAHEWERLAWLQMEAEDGFAGMPGPDAQPVAAAQWEELERSGRLVWQRLRVELGDGWRVGWAEFPGLPVRHVQWEPEGLVEPFPPTE